MKQKDWQLTTPQAMQDNIASWLAQARPVLAASAESPALEAQVILANVLQKPRSWIVAHPEFPLTATQRASLNDILQRRAMGEPLPYLIGHWEFFGLDFLVTPAVLVPRPETEQLVEEALHWLKSHPDRKRAVDVGTGSGCIAISLVYHVPDLFVLACDRSWNALQIARQNLARYANKLPIHLIQSDLLNAVTGPIDLILANLPYIPTPTLQDLPVARHEPVLALDGGPDGLALIGNLIDDAPRCLAPGGLMLLEVGADQGQQVLRLAHDRFPDASIDILTDMAGKDRILRIKRS